jgi:hypothetical protein
MRDGELELMRLLYVDEMVLGLLGRQPIEIRRLRNSVGPRGCANILSGQLRHTFL